MRRSKYNNMANTKQEQRHASKRRTAMSNAEHCRLYRQRKKAKLRAQKEAGLDASSNPESTSPLRSECAVAKQIKQECSTVNEDTEELPAVAEKQPMDDVAGVKVKLEPEEVQVMHQPSVKLENIKVEYPEDIIENVLPASESESFIGPSMLLDPLSIHARQPEEDFQMQPKIKEEITVIENEIEVRVYPTDEKATDNYYLPRCKINKVTIPKYNIAGKPIKDPVEEYIKRVVGKVFTTFKGTITAAPDIPEASFARQQQDYSRFRRGEVVPDAQRVYDDFDSFAEFIAPRLRQIESPEEQIEIMGKIIDLFPRFYQ